MTELIFIAGGTLMICAKLPRIMIGIVHPRFGLPLSSALVAAVGAAMIVIGLLMELRA